ncbi:MAG: hypothetical protein ACRDXF_01595 [Acidimicrobiia bacterium]
MRTLRRFGVTALVLTGLLAGSGVALAQTDDEDVIEIEDAEDVNDTLFNLGYDIFNRLFLWNLSALDGIFDCALENGVLTATYGETSEAGLVPVENLEGVAGVVEFPNRPADEVADDLEPADAPVAYAGADGECGLSGGEVSGPNGQVNHGMFMKLFNSLYEGRGRGCVVRHLAQSDLGKGDQQIQANDTTPFESVEAGDTGTVEFTSAEADCEHGRTAGEQDVGPESDAQAGNGSNGKPDHAGKPDDAGNRGSGGSAGNSGSAPGHNK